MEDGDENPATEPGPDRAAPATSCFDLSALSDADLLRVLTAAEAEARRRNLIRSEP